MIDRCKNVRDSETHQFLDWQYGRVRRCKCHDFETYIGFGGVLGERSRCGHMFRGEILCVP